MSTQWNQQLSRYVFSKVIECLEQKTNRLQKTIEYKTNEQSTKYSNWNMQLEIKTDKVLSTCSFCFCLFFVLS